MLRNETSRGVHSEHAYDHGDVKLPTALPWMHELGWPFTTVPLLTAPRVIFRLRTGQNLPASHDHRLTWLTRLMLYIDLSHQDALAKT